MGHSIRLNERQFRQIVKESVRRIVESIIDENRVITFDGKTYPNFGWCVVLSGHGGSGKGFALEKSIPIDGKIINVDHFKKMWVKMNGGLAPNGEPYDEGNPKHVSDVHYKVRELGWKKKTISNIEKEEAHNPEMLPNIIFDMTGVHPAESMKDTAKKAKELGYNTILIWVIANRSEALLRNSNRSRHVGDIFLHQHANSLVEEMPEFLKSNLATEYFDDAWLLFNSTETVKRSDLEGDERKTAAVKLERTNSGFIIDNETEERMKRYFGKMERNPINPQDYLTSQEIADKYGTVVNVTSVKPNFNDFSNPRISNKRQFAIDRNKVPDNFYRD